MRCGMDRALLPVIVLRFGESQSSGEEIQTRFARSALCVEKHARAFELFAAWMQSVHLL
jgi:hypothetical protein